MCTPKGVDILAKTKTTRQKKRFAARIRQDASNKLDRLMNACGHNPSGRDLRRARRLREMAEA